MRGSDEYDRPFLRLGEIMKRLALDPVAALQREPASLGAAIQRCQACQADAVCGDWLARAAARLQAPPMFCPNAEVFLTSRDEQPPADDQGPPPERYGAPRPERGDEDQPPPPDDPPSPPPPGDPR